MPRIYIDIDGTILSYEPGDGPSGKALKQGAVDFLEWLVKEFDCYWLTAWAVDGDDTGIRRDLEPFLPPSCHNIPVARWQSLKTEAFEREDGQFLWLDDSILHKEWQWLDEQGWSANVVLARASDGSVAAIESETKKKAKFLEERESQR